MVNSSRSEYEPCHAKMITISCVNSNCTGQTVHPHIWIRDVSFFFNIFYSIQWFCKGTLIALIRQHGTVKTLTRGMYRQPSIYRHTIQWQNSFIMVIGQAWNETFSKGDSESETMQEQCKKHVFWMFVRISSLRQFYQISKTYLLWGSD